LAYVPSSYFQAIGELMNQNIILVFAMMMLLVSCATKDEDFRVEIYSEGTNLTGENVELPICSYVTNTFIYDDGRQKVTERIIGSYHRISATSVRQKTRLPNDYGRVWWRVGLFDTPVKKPTVPSDPVKRSFQLSSESFEDYLLCTDPSTQDFFLLPKAGTCPAGTNPQLAAASCE